MSARGIEIDDNQYALIRKALADPKRFEMLERIGTSPRTPTCTCIGEWTGLAPATISHHIKELESAGLINVERNGKFAHITMRRDVWDAYIKRLAALGR